MFRISKLTDYGTMVMVYLAHHQHSVKTAKDITEETKIALPTVTKLLKILTRGKLLCSYRGMNGGYSLAKAPDQISIVNIVEAIEGTIGLTECSIQASHCYLEGKCITRHNWRFINQAIYQALYKINLADMAEPFTPFQSHELANNLVIPQFLLNQRVSK